MAHDRFPLLKAADETYVPLWLLTMESERKLVFGFQNAFKMWKSWSGEAEIRFFLKYSKKRRIKLLSFEGGWGIVRYFVKRAAHYCTDV